jgi:hypothetical protein
MSLRPVGVLMMFLLGWAAVALPSFARPAVAVAATPPGVNTGIALNSVGNAAGTALNAGKQLLGGSPLGAAGTLAGGAVGAASSATTGLALAAISASVADAARGVLGDTAAALGSTTSPQLRSTWFSSTYWRMAAVATVLTLPFLFAAAVQALIRSDLALLVRAAFGYLPLAMLAIGIAAPVTMLLLAACDELCSFISSAAANQSAHFLARIAVSAAGLAALSGSPFLAFFIGLFVIAATFALWVELLLREAAVYVIVLMLPLAFSAFVWPARRIWAIRAVELLAALILSKFAIVAVLSLGGAAVSSAGNSVTGLMAGAVLIVLAAFSPWALMRLIPLAELATGAAGPLRGELRAIGERAARAQGQALGLGDDWMRRAADMRRVADADVGGAGPAPGGTTAAESADRAPATPGANAPAQAETTAAEAATTTGEPATTTASPATTTGEAATTTGEPAATTASPATTTGEPATTTASPATTTGEAATTAGAASQPAGDEPPASRAETWSAQSPLELDRENLDSTPVWPNEDAE